MFFVCCTFSFLGSSAPRYFKDIHQQILPSATSHYIRCLDFDQYFRSQKGICAGVQSSGAIAAPLPRSHPAALWLKPSVQTYRLRCQTFLLPPQLRRHPGDRRKTFRRDASRGDASSTPATQRQGQAGAAFSPLDARSSKGFRCYRRKSRKICAATDAENTSLRRRRNRPTQAIRHPCAPS